MRIDGKNNNININQNFGVQPKSMPIKTKPVEDVFVPTFGRSEEPKKISFAQKISLKIHAILSGKNRDENIPTTQIPSKGFSTYVTNRTYVPSSVVGRKIDVSYLEPEYNLFSEISSEFNPGTLEIMKDVGDCLYASNFIDPGGTVAIPSSLDKTLATSDLFQCNGVALVDRKHNLQTLLHFAPGVNHKDNKALVEYLLSYMKPEDTEITIVPGRYPETNATIASLRKIIEKVSPDYDIKFMNFPDKEHSTLVLKNGELKCCKKSCPKEEHINPENIVVWAKHEHKR